MSDIVERANKALGGVTPGPWDLPEDRLSRWVMAGGLHVATIPMAGDGDWSPSNSRFIAAARELVPELVAEIERLRAENEELRDTLNGRTFTVDEGREWKARAEAAEAEIERLRAALEKIVQWADAYPTKVFPEPDFKRVAAALAAHGLSLDCVSASNMRHAIKGAGDIACTALEGEKT